MKFAKFGQKLKSSIRKHSVRKKEFEALAKEVKHLKKKLAKLEKCCSPVELENIDAAIEQQSPAKEQVKTSVASSTTAAEDKLTRIKGIGPVLEKKLHGLGITQFSQIARWGEEDIDKISDHLRFKGRIQREEWIKQAAELLN
jgi:large subunit ribosomal protein L21